MECVAFFVHCIRPYYAFVDSLCRPRQCRVDVPILHTCASLYFVYDIFIYLLILQRWIFMLYFQREVVACVGPSCVMDFIFLSRLRRLTSKVSPRSLSHDRLFWKKVTKLFQSFSKPDNLHSQPYTFHV